MVVYFSTFAVIDALRSTPVEGVPLQGGSLFNSLWSTMGAFVSIPDCKSHYDIILNCSVLDGYGHNVKFNGTWPEDVSFGSYKKGQFPGDPDIAGIGVRKRLARPRPLASPLIQNGVAFAYVRMKTDSRSLRRGHIIRLSS
jgi:hypothetical protein